MQALGSEHMRLDQRVQRLQHRRAGADQVGQRRQAQIDAFPRVALALPVQGLMLAELLEQDHRQQVRPGEAARRHMERRRRLGDRLAGPAGELLAHGLDHLPLPRNHLQRLGDVFAKLRQPVRAAAGTAGRCRDHDALARQVVGERLARRPLALERLDGLRSRRRLLGRQFILGGGCFQLFELKLHLLQQARRAFRTGAIKLAPQLLDLELEWLISASVLDRSALALAASALALAAAACALAASASASTRAARSARIIACAAARSVGSDSECRSQSDGITSITSRKQNPHPIEVGRQLSCGWRQSIPDKQITELRR